MGSEGCLQEGGGFLCAVRLRHVLAPGTASMYWCAASSSWFIAVCHATPAGLKFAQLVVGPEEQAQLAALGISKTPALVALKGSDLSQRTLYEGELKLSDRQGMELGHLSSTQPDLQRSVMAAVLSTVLQRRAFCVLPTLLSTPPLLLQVSSRRRASWIG